MPRTIRLVLLALLVSAALVRSAEQSAWADEPHVTIRIEPGVSQEDVAYAQEGVALARAYLNDTGFGAPESYLLVILRKTIDPTIDDYFGFYVNQIVVVITGTSEWVRLSPLERIQIVAHEYVHAAEFQGIALDRPDIPRWLIEGIAQYLSYSALVEAGLVERQDVREYHQWAVGSFPQLGLRHLERPYAFYTDPVAYNRSYLGIEQLMHRVHIDDLALYFNRLRTGYGAEMAFEKTFGVTIEEFYRDFDRQQWTIKAPAVPPVAFLPVIAQHVSSAVAIDDVPGFLAASNQLLVLGRAVPGSTCRFSLTPDGEAAAIKGETHADAAGRLFWLVTIPADTSPGWRTITVECGAEAVTAPIEILATDE